MWSFAFLRSQHRVLIKLSIAQPDPGASLLGWALLGKLQHCVNVNLNAPDHQTAKTSTFIEVLEVLTLAGYKQHLEDTETLNYYGSLEGIVFQRLHRLQWKLYFSHDNTYNSHEVMSRKQSAQHNKKKSTCYISDVQYAQNLNRT